MTHAAQCAPIKQITTMIVVLNNSNNNNVKKTITRFEDSQRNYRLKEKLQEINMWSGQTRKWQGETPFCCGVNCGSDSLQVFHKRDWMVIFWLIAEWGGTQRESTDVSGEIITKRILTWNSGGIKLSISKVSSNSSLRSSLIMSSKPSVSRWCSSSWSAI